MFKNNFKIFFRKLFKNKAASAINIFGLTIGLTSCLLIALYIQHELSYDDFQTNGSRIVRVIMEYKFGGSESNKGNYTSVRVSSVFKRTFPEVQSAVKMLQSTRVVDYKDKRFNEKRFMFADPAFFDILIQFWPLRTRSFLRLQLLKNILAMKTRQVSIYKSVTTATSTRLPGLCRTVLLTHR